MVQLYFNFLKLNQPTDCLIDERSKNGERIGGETNVKKKIIVVDDEKPIADILQFQFQKEGFSVKCAYNGLEALELIERIQPDVVLLDVMLPDRDGMEICREIRKKYNMPIIMLTASSSQRNRKRAFNLGVNNYVMKPFNTKKLVSLVEEVLTSKTLVVDIN